MSRGLTFVLDQLRPELRAQAQRQLDQMRATSTERTHILPGPGVTEFTNKMGPKQRHNRAPLIPRISEPEERLAFHLRAEGITDFKRQFKFLDDRRYMADFAWVKERLLVEVQGGVALRRRRSHTGIEGYHRDRVRSNLAQLAGWRILEFIPIDVKKGRAVRLIKMALAR